MWIFANSRSLRSGIRSSFLKAALAGVVCICFGKVGLTKDAEDAEDDDSGKSSSAVPTTYLDLRTNYGSVPAGSLIIGLGKPNPFSALQALPSGNPLLTLPITVPFAARQAVWVDVPATVDVTDHVSLYAGVTASSTSVGAEGWSSFAVTSWNVGFQADLYAQNGGSIPTITWQSTITESIPNGPLATTSFYNIFEFDYAFDKDETRGCFSAFRMRAWWSPAPWQLSIHISPAMSAVITNGRTTGNLPDALACNTSAGRRS